jgi:hypothetical protein
MLRGQAARPSIGAPERDGEPRAGISEGVVANRPRSASKRSSPGCAPGFANRCGRNPRINNAVVSAVPQNGMRPTARSAFAMRGLRQACFTHRGLLREGGRGGDVLGLRGWHKLGSPTQVLSLGLLLGFFVGVRGDFLGLCVLLAGKRLRPFFELMS